MAAAAPPVEAQAASSHEDLGEVTIKGGDVVEAVVVLSRDAEWRDRAAALLKVWGDPWVLQISALTRGQDAHGDVGIVGRFYMLHRAGVPIAGITTVERAGVGTLGNVWTVPTERRKGCMSELLRLLLRHFCARGGVALFLGTGHGNKAFRVYETLGFRVVEPKSGYMDFYCGCTREQFEADYFALAAPAGRPSPWAGTVPAGTAAEAVIEPVDWQHYGSAPPLFLTGTIPGVVRCSCLNLMGRSRRSPPAAARAPAPLPLPRRGDWSGARGVSPSHVCICSGLPMVAWQGASLRSCH